MKFTAGRNSGFYIFFSLNNGANGEHSYSIDISDKFAAEDAAYNHFRNFVADIELPEDLTEARKTFDLFIDVRDVDVCLYEK